MPAALSPRPARPPATSGSLQAPRLAHRRGQVTARWWRLLPLLLALAVPAVRAGRDGDHDRARAAVQAGEVLPLPAVLERLKRSHPGQVLELELEREGGQWVYEVKLLAPDGQLLKLLLDARTGAVLAERRRAEAGRRGRERDSERPREGDRR
jgi:uncharacterized membrane protein YkoI